MTREEIEQRMDELAREYDETMAQTSHTRFTNWPASLRS
jgi:hypothetical protein